MTRTIPWPRNEERETANLRFSPGREVHLPLRRRGHRSRDRDLHRGGDVAVLAARRRRAGPHQPRARPRLLRRARHLHRALHDAGSHPEAPDHGHRQGGPDRAHDRLPPDRAGRAGVVHAGAGSEACLRDQERHRRATSSGRSTSRRPPSSAGRSSTGRPRMVPARELERQGHLRVHRGRDHRPLRRRDLQVPAHHPHGCGPDDRDVRRASLPPARPARAEGS